MHASPRKYVRRVARLDLEAPSGFCPACLLGTALEIDTTDPSEISAAGTRIEDYEIINEVVRAGWASCIEPPKPSESRRGVKMILRSQIAWLGASRVFRRKPKLQQVRPRIHPAGLCGGGRRRRVVLQHEVRGRRDALCADRQLSRQTTRSCRIDRETGARRRVCARARNSASRFETRKCPLRFRWQSVT